MVLEKLCLGQLCVLKRQRIHNKNRGRSDLFPVVVDEVNLTRNSLEKETFGTQSVQHRFMTHFFDENGKCFFLFFSSDDQEREKGDKVLVATTRINLLWKFWRALCFCTSQFVSRLRFELGGAI